MQAPERSSPSITRVIVFFLAFVLSGEVVSIVLSLVGLSDLNGPVVEGGGYTILWLPLIYWANPQVFTREFWHVRIQAGVGIVGLAFLQVLLNSTSVTPPFAKYRILTAILIAPPLEEMARAAMMCPLVQRMGVFWAVVTTASLWATAHAHFWIALIQQLALSLIFIYSRRSLPVTITAHLVMNVLAIVGLRFYGFQS